MFHFIQLYVRFGGLEAEGFEEKKMDLMTS